MLLGITLDWVPSSSNNRFLDHAYLSIPKSVQALLDMMPGGVSSIKVRSTPGNHLITLSKAMCIPDDQQDAQDEDTQSLYRSAVGLLIWIQQTVRYDISYATQRLSSFLANPGIIGLVASSMMCSTNDNWFYLVGCFIVYLSNPSRMSIYHFGGMCSFNEFPV